MKTIRIILLILIVIGIGLLCTQKFWVDPLVNYILNLETHGNALNSQTIEDISVQTVNKVVSVKSEWKRFESKALGIALLLEEEKGTDANILDKVFQGDTGKGIAAEMLLDSGAQLDLISMTNDYTAPKDGPPVGAWGYVFKNGQYFQRWQERVWEEPFVPDEILKLDNGLVIPIIYGKNFDPYGVYPEMAIKALVNLPNSEFKGIGFSLYKSDSKGYDTAATPEEIATFKKVLSSIELTK